jgi:hypothetical protein
MIATTMLSMIMTDPPDTIRNTRLRMSGLNAGPVVVGDVELRMTSMDSTLLHALAT